MADDPDIALIGVGRIGLVHAQTPSRSVPGDRLLGVAGVRVEAAQASQHSSVRGPSTWNLRRPDTAIAADRSTDVKLADRRQPPLRRRLPASS